MGAEGYIAIPIVFVAIVFLAGFCRWYRRRNAVAYNGRSRKALEKEYQRQVAKKDEQMRVEVQKRRAEEDDTTRGKQVWFSRYIHNGRFKHWVLIIEGTKYELRRDDSNGTYMANVAPWTIDKERREAAIADEGIPNVDGYYVCLIGWTQREPGELQKICDEVMTEFGKYNLVWNNCQHFLQAFGDRVISAKALDWSWFREYTKTEYQETQALRIPTPDEIIAANRARAQQQLNMQQNNQQNHHRHIQHNVDAMSHQLHIHAHSQLQAQQQSLMANIQMQNLQIQQNNIQMQTMG
ncbi:hypothetical protein F5Y08DRAFT_7076 [Xylaria arbuscula]|nr:hypothetical protein F5Y08DRAFT_7076 [Xylaria arbuscula]